MSTFKNKFCYIFLLIVLLAGCGYHLRGTSALYEKHKIKYLAIPVFANKTFEPHIERMVTDALIEEMKYSGDIIITSRNSADAELTGSIKSFSSSIVSTLRGDMAYEYRITFVISAVLTDLKSGKVIWRDDNIVAEQIFKAGSTPLLHEGSKREAVKNAAYAAAREIYHRVNEDF